jgi:hypothetical protein
MKEIFIAVIFVFDVQTGLPLEASFAAFEEEEACVEVISRTTQKASEDMTIYLEATCLPTPLFTSAS